MNFSEVVSITYCSPLGSHLLFSPLLVEGHPGSFFTGPLLYCLYLLGSYKKAWTVPIGQSHLSKPWSPCAVWVPSSLPTPFPSSAELRGSVVSAYGGLARSPVAPWSELRPSPTPGHTCKTHMHVMSGWRILVFMTFHTTCLPLFLLHCNRVKHES